MVVVAVDVVDSKATPAIKLSRGANRIAQNQSASLPNSPIRASVRSHPIPSSTLARLFFVLGFAVLVRGSRVCLRISP